MTATSDKYAKQHRKLTHVLVQLSYTNASKTAEDALRVKSRGKFRTLQPVKIPSNDKRTQLLALQAKVHLKGSASPDAELQVIFPRDYDTSPPSVTIQTEGNYRRFNRATTAYIREWKTNNEGNLALLLQEISYNAGIKWPDGAGTSPGRPYSTLPRRRAVRRSCESSGSSTNVNRTTADPSSTDNDGDLGGRHNVPCVNDDSGISVTYPNDVSFAELRLSDTSSVDLSHEPFKKKLDEQLRAGQQSRHMGGCVHCGCHVASSREAFHQSRGQTVVNTTSQIQQYPQGQRQMQSTGRTTKHRAAELEQARVISGTKHQNATSQPKSSHRLGKDHTKTVARHKQRVPSSDGCRYQNAEAFSGMTENEVYGQEVFFNQPPSGIPNSIQYENQKHTARNPDSTRSLDTSSLHDLKTEQLSELRADSSSAASLRNSTVQTTMSFDSQSLLALGIIPDGTVKADDRQVFAGASLAGGIPVQDEDHNESSRYENLLCTQCHQATVARLLGMVTSVQQNSSQNSS